MGSIRLDQWQGQPVYIVRYRATIDIAINLQDEEWIDLAVRFTPHARAEPMSETLPSSWGIDCPEDLQTRLAVTPANTLALQATGFD